MAEPESEPPVLRIETIEGVKPLDRQIGLFPKKTVPETLYDALFGQPAPTSVEFDAAGGNPAAVPPMQTYAILDASKIPNLPELLEDSRLVYRCLFKSGAYDELKDVAPWVLRLEEGNSFTRNLFTRSDAPWHVWDREPGIYIRARRDLDEMWRHFRKFTRIKDETGKWFFQRFWEPRMIRDYAESSSSPFTGGDIASVVAISFEIGKATVVTPAPKTLTAVPVLLQSDRRRFAEGATRQFAEKLAADLFKAVPGQSKRLGLKTAEPLAQSFLYISEAMARMDIRRAADVARICACAYFYGTHFLQDPRVVPVMSAKLNRPKQAASLRALRFDEALRDDPRHRHVTTNKGVEHLLADLKHLQATGQQARVSAEEAGFLSAAECEAFQTACRLGWHQAGLPIEEDSLRRRAHSRIALLWTPWFMQDPLHAVTREALLRSSRNDLEVLIDIFCGRIGKE
ncbi:DUF4123 domain-containing protein [Paracoccus xiamenensis]|uniref:DUF4123 domain-containing protein n=1 Tax=Paracoccus xiamenensis TaxID=2714901 RepID=UPI00140DF43B|nr:DUF4123 domain-containing protein [Paracoccus xiamenensis]NHF73785.1 DUF4123 domain-containing protein [Paracoccus xiamenensis]